MLVFHTRLELGVLGETRLIGGSVNNVSKTSFRTRIALLCALFMVVLVALPATAGAVFNVSAFSLAPSTKQAAAHPTLTFKFTRTGTYSEDLRDVVVDYPSGQLFNPEAATTKCSPAQFNADQCPTASFVGAVSSSIVRESIFSVSTTVRGGVYVLEASGTDHAVLGYILRPSWAPKVFLKQVINIRSDSDSSQRTTTTNIPRTYAWWFPQVFGSTNIAVKNMTVTYNARANSTKSGPYFTLNPSDCVSKTAVLTATSYQNVTKSAQYIWTPTGCASVPLAPTVTTQLDANGAGQFTGGTFTVEVPANDTTVQNSTIKRVEALLPTGTQLNFAALGAINGGVGCSEAELAASACPPATQIGTATAEVPFYPNSPATAHSGPIFIMDPIDSTIYFAVALDGPRGMKTIVRSYSGVVGSGPSARVYNNWDYVPNFPWKKFTMNISIPLLKNPSTCESGQSSAVTFTGYSGAVTTVNSPYAVDCTTPPVDTAITAAPPAFADGAAQSVEFESDDPTATFECSVDGASWQVCGSPFTQSYADGAHTVMVRAVSATGNPDPTPVQTSFEVDTQTPNVMVDPVTSPTGDRTPSVTFFAGDPAPGTPLTTECAVDGGSWAPCSSPFTTDPLADGFHLVAVRATDSAGNAATSATDFTVDSTPPPPPVISAIPSPTNDNTPTLAFSLGAPGGVVTCQVDSGATYMCVSGDSLSSLADGLHTVTVTQTDDAGNSSSASRTFEVDTTPPAVWVNCQQNSNGSVTCTWSPSGGMVWVPFPPGFVGVCVIGVPSPCNGDTGYWAGGANCSLDGGAYSSCTSPFTFSASNGNHTFSVRVSDDAGNVGSGGVTFVVDKTPPAVFITAPPLGSVTNDNTPDVVFVATDSSPTSATCQIDGGAQAPCASPYTSAALTDGNHMATVRVTDAFGNIATVSTTFVVDTIPVEPPQIFSPLDGESYEPGPIPVSIATGEPGTETCSTDGAPFAGCPATLEGLAVGTHTFCVRIVDALGDIAQSCVTFTIAAIEFDVQITTGPEGGLAISDPTPEWSFVSTPAGATFECQIDGGSYAPCASPYRVSDDRSTGGANGFDTGDGLGGAPNGKIDADESGSHTFVVRATGGANVDTASFAVDEFDPSFAATMVDPTDSFDVDGNDAGSHPDVSMQVVLAAGDLSGLDVSVPDGVVVSSAPAVLCSQADALSGACLAASRVGDVDLNAAVNRTAHDSIAGPHLLARSGAVYVTEPWSPGDLSGMVAELQLLDIDGRDYGAVHQPLRVVLDNVSTDDDLTPTVEENTSVSNPRGVRVLAADLPTLSPAAADGASLEVHTRDLELTLWGDRGHYSNPLFTNSFDCEGVPNPDDGTLAQWRVAASGPAHTGTPTESDSSEPVQSYGVDNCEDTSFSPVIEQMKFTSKVDGSSTDNPSDAPPKYSTVDGNPTTSTPLDAEITIGTSAGDAPIRRATISLPPSIRQRSAGFLLAGNCLSNDTQQNVDRDLDGNGSLETTDYVNCPVADTQIGTVTVESPLFGTPQSGAVFLEDTGGAIPAFYVVLRNQGIGLNERFRLYTEIHSPSGGMSYMAEQLNSDAANAPADMPKLPITRMAFALGGSVNQGAVFEVASQCQDLDAGFMNARSWSDPDTDGDGKTTTAMGPQMHFGTASSPCVPVSSALTDNPADADPGASPVAGDITTDDTPTWTATRSYTNSSGVTRYAWLECSLDGAAWTYCDDYTAGTFSGAYETVANGTTTTITRIVGPRSAQRPLAHGDAHKFALRLKSHSSKPTCGTGCNPSGSGTVVNFPAMAFSTTEVPFKVIDTSSGGTVAITSPLSGTTTGDNTPALQYSVSNPNPGTVECSIDGAVYGPCPSDLGPLADGQHTVSVRHVDTLGSVSVGVSVFRVDTTGPAVSVAVSLPPGSEHTPTVTFTAADVSTPLSAAECSVDGGAPFACASGDSLPTLGDGSHTVVVTLSDAVGNGGFGIATFMIDTGAPTVSVTAPSGTTADSSPPIAFTATDALSAIVSTTCSVDGGTAFPCASGDSLPTRDNGLHMLVIVAYDEFGNAGTGSSAFTVLHTPLTPPVIHAPSGLIADATPELDIDVDPASTSVTCVIDSLPTGACVDGDNLAPLAEGTHSLTVVATDDVGDAFPSLPSAFEVDTLAPVVSINSPGDGSILSDPTPALSFSVADQNPGTSTCSLNGAVPGPCPAELGPLSMGVYSLTVAHVDAAGNAGSATVSFTDDPGLPPVTPETQITTGPEGGLDITDPTPEWEFSSDQPSATFECSLDGAAFAACASPYRVADDRSTGGANGYDTGDGAGGTPNGKIDADEAGAHDFRVRAVAAGNTDATPDLASFEVARFEPAFTVSMADPSDPSDVEGNDAGAHPDVTLNATNPAGDVENVVAFGPDYAWGSNHAVPLCSTTDADAGNCLTASKIGEITVTADVNRAPHDSIAGLHSLTVSGDVYLTEKWSPGEAAGAVAELHVVDADARDYGTVNQRIHLMVDTVNTDDSSTPDIVENTSIRSPRGLKAVIESVPRISPLAVDGAKLELHGRQLTGTVWGNRAHYDAPLIYNSVDCSGTPDPEVQPDPDTGDPHAVQWKSSVETYGHTGSATERDRKTLTQAYSVDNCENVPFAPLIEELELESAYDGRKASDANNPPGARADADNDGDFDGDDPSNPLIARATVSVPPESSTLRNAVINLPPGLRQRTPGLAGACTTQDTQQNTTRLLHGDTVTVTDYVNCNIENSQVGIVEIISPLIETPQQGEVFLEDTGGAIPAMYAIVRNQELGINARVRTYPEAISVPSGGGGLSFLRATVNAAVDNTPADLPSLPITRLSLVLAGSQTNHEILEIASQCNDVEAGFGNARSWSDADVDGDGKTTTIMGPKLHFGNAASPCLPVSTTLTNNALDADPGDSPTAGDVTADDSPTWVGHRAYSNTSGAARYVWLECSIDAGAWSFCGQYNRGVDEVQRVTRTGTVTAGGTFTITYAGQTTAEIACSATAGTVQTALIGLSTIGPGNVAVTGGALSSTSPLTITFVNGMGAMDASGIVVSQPVAGCGTLTPSTVTPGVDGTFPRYYQVVQNGQTVDHTRTVSVPGLAALSPGNGHKFSMRMKAHTVAPACTVASCVSTALGMAQNIPGMTFGTVEMAFKVDTATPTGTRIDQGPADGATTSDSPVYLFGSDDITANFQCSIDSGAWVICPSGQRLPGSPYAAGSSHSFAARAWDGVNGDPTPVTRSFTVAP